MHITEIYNKLDKLYPFSAAESFDNSGYVYISENKEITKAVLCLDITDEVINTAKEQGAQLIVCHHPLIFDGIKMLDEKRDALYIKLVKYGISAISLHTNFDVAENGLNENCAAVIGIKGNNLYNENGIVYGDFGTEDLQNIALNIKNSLGVDRLRYFDSGKPVKTAALVCGAGFSFFESAAEKGIDLFITGECKYHHFIKAKQYGISLIDAGHFFTERIFSRVIEKPISEMGIKTIVFEDKLFYNEI